MGKKPPRKGFDLERIDKLLAQFPDEEPDAPTPKDVRGQPVPQRGQAHPSSGVQHTETLSSRRPLIGSWIRVAAGLALAFGITQWPYAHACGLGLFLYLAAVAGVVVVGAWAAVHTWGSHSGVPHMLAHGVLIWGLGLALFVLLPRVGYAKTEAAWLCRTQAPTPSSVPAPVPVESTSPQQAGPGEAVAAGGSATTTDSLTSLDSIVRADSVTPSDSVPAVVPDTSSSAA